MLGARKRVANGKRRSKCFSICANRRTANKECPPSSKKLSLTPGCVTLSKSDQIRANTFSTVVRGCLETACCLLFKSSTVGNALRLSLPLPVIGNDSSTTKKDGTRYPARCSVKN